MIVGVIVAALLEAGGALRDGMQKAGGWPAYVRGPDFAALHGKLDSVIASMRGNDLQVALTDVQQKETALLAGRSFSALTSDELDRYYALQDVRHALTIKELTDANLPRPDFAKVLLDSAFPILEKAAPFLVGLIL